MAGMPLRREKLKAAEGATEEIRARLDAMRVNLVKLGIDPNKVDPAGAVFEAPSLTKYASTLPLALARLASTGQSIEEIRIALGFTEAQQREWSDSYVDFREAIARVRAREEAFWQGQARQAAKTGDRPGFTAISALIQKRFTENASNNDATVLLSLRPGHRRAQPVSTDE